MLQLEVATEYLSSNFNGFASVKLFCEIFIFAGGTEEMIGELHFVNERIVINMLLFYLAIFSVYSGYNVVYALGTLREESGRNRSEKGV